MAADLGDLTSFVSVARAGGFRDAARASGRSASTLSEAVRRLEEGLGVRLLNRTTRSVAPTEAGARLLDRLTPALGEVEAALDVVNRFRDRPAGTLRLNVPISAARLVLPTLLPPFLAAFPDITLDVIADDSFVDMLRLRGGLRCGESVTSERTSSRDMIAIVPLARREQRFATAAAPAYLDRHGRPDHPRDLLDHACLLGRFSSGAMTVWEFERNGEIVTVNPTGPLIVRVGAATDLAVEAAVAGSGIIQLFEDWLRPHLDSGALEPVLEPWWQRFSGPYLYYPGRRYLPAPLRAFVDFIRAKRRERTTRSPHRREADKRSVIGASRPDRVSRVVRA